MVNFKENYPFSRFLRGSNIFQGGGGDPTFSGGGGVQLLIPYRKYITCDFPGEVRTPCPLWIRTRDCPWYYHASNLTNRYLCMFLEGQVDRQTDRQTDRRVHRRPTPKQYPSDFIGGKPVLSTGYLVSCSRT